MNIRDPNLPVNLTSFRALQDEVRKLDAALSAAPEARYPRRFEDAEQQLRENEFCAGWNAALAAAAGGVQRG